MYCKLIDSLAESDEWEDGDIVSDTDDADHPEVDGEMFDVRHLDDLAACAVLLVPALRLFLRLFIHPCQQQRAPQGQHRRYSR